MAEPTSLPIANGFYLSGAPLVSAQQCVNFYPQVITEPALSQEVLFPTAGLFEIENSGILEPNRGSLTVDGVPFFVNGNNLYRLDNPAPDTYSLTLLGAISGSGRVSMATNGDYLVILVPGGIGSTWQVSSSTFTPDINAVDSDFTANGAPQYVVYVDGYFLFTTDEKKFIISALNDPLSYNALDFGTAEADPDDIVGVVVYFNQVFILGQLTIEGFENVGGSGFPFQRNGLIDDTGCRSAFSIVKGDDSFYFVGSSENEGPSIYQFKGNRSTKISNTAVDRQLQQLMDDELANIYGIHYGQNGQFFTAFTVQGRDQTIEYNALTGKWNQRQSTIVDSVTNWRVASVVFSYGRLICGDVIDGRIGILDLDTYTEYGEPILRRLDTMPFSNNGNSFSVSSLELTVQSGVGDLVTTDPQVRMSRSVDGGNNFTDELSRSMGKIGEYFRRAIWRRLGRQPRFVMFRFETSDPVNTVFVKLQARFRSGTR